MAEPSYPLSIPTTPSNFSTSEWTIIRTVAVSQSPFTYKSQSADFGGAIWQTTVELPIMNREQSSLWTSFFMQLHGRAGTFLLGDPDARAIRGGLTSSIQTNTTASVGAYDIVIDGANASTLIFKAGDYIQLGSGASSKLHMIVANVTSNSSGVATLPIEPPLKTAIGNDSQVIYENTKAVMRMDTNDLGWSANQSNNYKFSFTCSEVI